MKYYWMMIDRKDKSTIQTVQFIHRDTLCSWHGMLVCKHHLIKWWSGETAWNKPGTVSWMEDGWLNSEFDTVVTFCRVTAVDFGCSWLMSLEMQGTSLWRKVTWSSFWRKQRTDTGEFQLLPVQGSGKSVSFTWPAVCFLVLLLKYLAIGGPLYSLIWGVRTQPIPRQEETSHKWDK